MSSPKVVIMKPNRLETIKQKIINDGPQKLQVLSDFDKTLTKSFVNGKKIVSLISVLRDGDYLTPDYAAKAQALYDHYHPFEVNQDIPFKEKQQLMHEWWSVHYELLKQAGLNKQIIQKAVESKKVELRAGASEFFKLLEIEQIPLVILSAAGVGVDAIAMYLEQVGQLYLNIHIAGNQLEWDALGKFIGVKKPIIHSLNKNYSIIKNFVIYEKVKDRTNAMLLGNSINDLQMLEGFAFENIIKIGFLNEPSEEKLHEFKEFFDVVILNDGPLDYVNALLKELAEKK